MRETPEIIVLTVGENEWGMLEELVAAIEAEDPDTATCDGLQRFLDRFAPLDPSRPVWLFMALVESDAVGMLCCTAVPKLDPRGGFLFVDEIYVLSGHRRRGVGRALMEAAIQRAATLDLAGVRLLSRPENHGAEAFYASLGFTASDARFHQRRV
jgi:ribosomal protein S18 acetylase RimI-like enzyme